MLPLRGLGDLSLFQYLADIPLASLDPYFLYAMFHYAQHLLTSAGFLISPKSSTVPPTRIMWLGKAIDSGPTKLTHFPSREASVILSIFHLRHARLHLRHLARILGALQWLAVGFPRL